MEAELKAQPTFQTTTPEIAAALLERGFTLVKTRPGERVTFVFTASTAEETAETVAVKYWDGKMTVEPGAFLGFLRRINGMIRSSRGGVR